MNQEIFSLRRDSPDLYPVLNDGTLMRYGETWAALPRELVENSTGIDSVVFEVIRPEGIVKPSDFTIWWTAIRPMSLARSFLPMMGVYFYGLASGWVPSKALGILALLGVVFFQISVNLLNDVEDHLRLVDLPGGLGGSGVLQKGWVSAKSLRKLGHRTLALGIVLGLPAVLQNPDCLFVIGGMGAFGVLGYSSRPFGMKYRALGDISLFVLLGPLLTIGFSQAVFGKTDEAVTLLGLFFGFASWAISHANNLQDMETDTSLGVFTLASQLGFKTSRHLFFGLYLLALGSIWGGVALGHLPAYVGLAILVGVPSVIRLTRRVYKAAGPASALLGSVRFDAARVHLLLGVCTCLGLIAAYMINASVYH